VVTSRIRGVSPSPSGILYNFNEWYVPKTQQRYTVRLDGALRPPEAPPLDPRS